VNSVVSWTTRIKPSVAAKRRLSSPSASTAAGGGRCWALSAPLTSLRGIGRSPMDIGPSEAETFWTAFLRKLARRGLRGVKPVIADAHEGIKAAAAKVLSTAWRRCRVHLARNVLAHAGRSGRRVVAAFIATGVPSPPKAGLGWAAAFARNGAEAAKLQWRPRRASSPACLRHRIERAALDGRRPSTTPPSTTGRRCPSSPP
jgi:Transposase, Mutator family